MLSTDKQTDKQTDRQTDRQTKQRYQKHNLLCQGGNKLHDICGTVCLVLFNHIVYPVSSIIIEFGLYML